MTIRLLARSLWLIALLLLGSGAAFAAPEPPKRMNILFVIADDMGLQLGCYGDKQARTPNLDKFAAQNVRFSRAWVTQASCSPSRASFLTGLYPHQNGQLGLSHIKPPYSMPHGIANLPALLKSAGYYNGIIGKLHVEPRKEFPFDFGSTDYWGDTQETPDVRLVADKVDKFIKQAGTKPFFLYLNYKDPHEPFETQRKGLPPKPFTAADITPWPFLGSETPGLREKLAGYYNGCARVDIGMGMVLDVLEKTGHARDTLVVFIGDHGPPFSRAKTTCFEAGMAVPMIIRWPGRSKQGLVSDALVSCVDLPSTILEAAGVTPPPGFAGKSLAPLLEGQPAEGREYLFGEFNSHQHPNFYPQRCVRDARYKLIVNLLAGQPTPWRVSKPRDPATKFTSPQAEAAAEMRKNPPPEEFYDLQTDPNEFVNLGGKPEVKAEQDRLRKALQAWREQTADPMLDPAKFAALCKKEEQIPKAPKAKESGD